MSESSVFTPSAIAEMQVSYYLDVATCTLVIFDYIINLNRELHMIWTSRRSKSYGGLYLCLRYFGLIYASWPILPRLNIISYQFCYASIITQQIILRIILGLALDGMMTLRIHALYGRSYKILAPLGICFAFEQIASVLQLSVVHPGITVIAYEGPGVDNDACVLEPSDLYVALYVAASSAFLAYHSLLLAMSCYSFARHVHEQRRLLSGTWEAGGLYMLIVRQHLLYFLLAALTSAIGIISFYYAPAAVANGSPMGGTTLNVLQRTSDVVQLCIIGPYMMLSVREHNDHLERGSSQTGTAMLASIRFATRLGRPDDTIGDDDVI